MEAINQLEYSYFLARSGCGDYRDCIDWALDRLRRNETVHTLESKLQRLYTHLQHPGSNVSRRHGI